MDNLLTNAFDWIAGKARQVTIPAPEVPTLVASDYTLFSEPGVASIRVESLTGLLDYLRDVYPVERNKRRVDELPLVMIDSPSRVGVKTTLTGPFGARRETLLLAECQGDRFEFGTRNDQERFIIGLRSQFVLTDELSELLQIVGRASSVASQAQEDDGVTQRVELKKGVVLKAEGSVKPIWKLRPFRTFREIEQPESEFLLRISEDLKFSLHEADGGAWQNSARLAIKAYLSERMEGVPILA